MIIPSILSLIFVALCTADIVDDLRNTCPDYFEYYYNYNTKRTDGLLTIPSEVFDGNRILNLIVAVGSDGAVHNNSHSIDFFKPRQEIIEDIKRGLDIHYKILLPQGEMIPVIISILANRKFLCGDLSVLTKHHWLLNKVFTNFDQKLHQIEVPELNKNRTYESSTRNNPMPTKPNNGTWLQNLPFSCGKPSNESSIGTSTIFGGVLVEPGEFPWLVLLIIKGSSFCGASLISDKYVITAGHCVHNKTVQYLIFGKYNRLESEEGSIMRKPENIIIHKDYMDKKAKGDIALISFERIKFTNKISPICIWPFGEQFDKSENINFGTVAGWGLLENGSTATVPMKTSVDIVDQDMCKKSHNIFQNIVKNQTFCAGGNFSGPCLGDSGGGFYILHNDTRYLRGIVSVALVEKYDPTFCLTDFYAVYVDISYYLDWLQPYIIN